MTDDDRDIIILDQPLEETRSSFLSPPLDREPLKEVIESYIRYYASGQSHTARAKRYDLEHFLDFLAGPQGRIEDLNVSDWTMDATKAFLDYRLDGGEAPASVNRRLATLKHLGRTLAERIPGYVNPAREVRGPHEQTTKPHGLTVEEIAALRQAAQPSAPTFQALRNQFLLELLLATGLRADEVRVLTIGQIAEDFSWLRNVRTKGKKYRSVYLDSEIRPKLLEYLRLREEALSKHLPGILTSPRTELDKLPLFLSFHGARLSKPSSFGLSPKTVWRIIASFGHSAKRFVNDPLSKLHPHRLRHTFALGLLDSSNDIRLVAQALGHSDVRTTMRYTERSEEQLQEAVEAKVKRDKKGAR